MKLFAAMVLASGLSLAAAGGDEVYTLEDLVAAGEEWVEANIDEEVLGMLSELDMPAVQDFLDDMLQRLHAGNVVDLSQLNGVAISSLKLLEAHEETQGYAEWLRTRMDYFEVAEQLRVTALPPAPQPEPAIVSPSEPAPVPPPVVPPSEPAPLPPPVVPPPPIPNPPAEKEREVWRKKLEKRPPPSGAEAFAARLKPVFVAEKVPAELVWLAEVESSFSPRARSPAGAVGLYQLMPDTARGLNMSLWPKDQRLNPEKNANGAARHLKALHGKFNNWPLALAAYNSGEGRVERLLRKHKAKTFDGISRHLPAETQMYVPKINATLLRREGISLADLKIP